MASVTKWVMFLNTYADALNNLSKWQMVGNGVDDVERFRKNWCFPSREEGVSWLQQIYKDRISPKYVIIPVTWEE